MFDQKTITTYAGSIEKYNNILLKKSYRSIGAKTPLIGFFESSNIGAIIAPMPYGTISKE